VFSSNTSPATLIDVSAREFTVPKHGYVFPSLPREDSESGGVGSEAFAAVVGRASELVINHVAGAADTAAQNLFDKKIVGDAVKHTVTCVISNHVSCLDDENIPQEPVGLGGPQSGTMDEVAKEKLKKRYKT
jgi:hypothetical protein